MKNGFIVGAAVGMVVGAMLVNNSSRVKQMVSDTKQRIKNKATLVKDAMEQSDNCCCSSGEQNNQNDYMN